MTTKLCKDCRWVKRERYLLVFPFPWELAQCRHPVLVSLVSGDVDEQFASNLRERASKCGPEGRLWVPK